jgi:hypothetical protein
MPGVTIVSPGKRARSVSISRGDATTPSRPALSARAASASTWRSIDRPIPISTSASSSRLVRAVTATIIGTGLSAADAASTAARFAARSIAEPPDAWTVIIQTPSSWRLHGSGDLMRDVVELQVEKHPVALLDKAPDERRPLCREEGAADLDAADLPRSRSASSVA